jgi:hypothetical protein
VDVGGSVRPPYDGIRALAAWAWDNRRLIQGRVTLAGGDAGLLTIGDALDAGYALAVESYVRLGMDLLTAVSNVDKTLGLPTHEAPNLPTPIDNAKALEQLEAMVRKIR